MLTRTLAAAMTLLAIQTLPTFAGPIGRRAPGGVVSDTNASRAEPIARLGRGEQPVRAFDKRVGKNSTAAAAPAAAPHAAAPPPSLSTSKALLPSASAAAPKGSAALQPSASAAAPKGSTALQPSAIQPSASAAIPKGTLSASANATGTVFPTALPSGVSIVVPSDFPGLGPESGTGVPLVTTLFSAPAVALSTIAGSGADAAPAASATGPAPVAGSPAAASPAVATAAAATGKATVPTAVSRRSRRSTTVREARKRGMRTIARESVLDGLD